MGNAIFPTLPGLKAERGRLARFKTGILTAVSGKEFRSGRMANPIYEFSLPHEFLRETGGRTELRTLEGFFLARRGAWESFLYSCPHDCETVEETFGVGDGQRNAFQLVRSYGEFIEPVQNISQIRSIRRGGQLLNLGTDYTVSATGMVVFNDVVPAGAELRWSGLFFFRCRFKQDEASFDRFALNLYKAGRVEFIGTLGVKI